MRPERKGIWFTVHASMLLNIEYEDTCDIYEEFLKHHPNGGEKTAGFVGVQLSKGQIKKYWHLIRISSYRWRNVKGIGVKGDENSIPDNYSEFLALIRERGQILWMDWMSHVGVNAPLAVTLKYMGSLYAENIVLGDWMLDLDKVPIALTRAWIFQEMSFGSLDKVAMRGLFQQLRNRGRAVSKNPKDVTVFKAYMLGSLDELVQRYARGLISAALGCEVTKEYDREKATTDVMLTIAETRFGVKLSAAELMKRAWQSALAQVERAFPFGVSKVHAPITADSTSFALAPLQLSGAWVTINENSASSLTCKYRTADGSIAPFDERNGGVVFHTVASAGLRGIVKVDERHGLPQKPLPKPQDGDGAEADICLCVLGAEPFARTFNGFTFALILQPWKKGSVVEMMQDEPPTPMNGYRVTSLQVVAQAVPGDCDVRGKPPRPDVRFY